VGQTIRTLERADLPRLFELYRHLHANDDPVSSDEAAAVWDKLWVDSYPQISPAALDLDRPA